MYKIGTIEYRHIERISPSQFSSLKNCQYKGILAKAFDNIPLLTLSPNAYLGTVLHKVLELISRGLIRDEVQLNANFNKELTELEQKLTNNGLRQYVPLQMNVPDFGLKKIQLKKHLFVHENKNSKISNYSPEKWLESQDKKIGGRVDLIIEADQFIEIIDFKTGAITEDILDDTGEIFKELKIEYREQLKLYAYLYYERTGKFPSLLSIVDLRKQKFSLEFTFEECKAIFQQAKDLLNDINNSIDTKQFNANPNKQNCKFCLYRPACSFYLNNLNYNYPFNDVSGFITKVKQYQNGNVSVFVMDLSNQNVTITGFSSEYYSYFEGMANQKINIFNLKKESTNMVYSVTRTTKFYE
jgi:CRISPR/Cas system-associated exonuclease Cas4 (RecB family)